MKHWLFAIITILVFSGGCGTRNQAISDIRTGRAIDDDGSIIDNSKKYTFKRLHDGKTVKDLFNHLYFQGDEIFFSFCIAVDAPPKNLKISFNDPVSGNSLEAERTEYIKQGFILNRNIRIYGFSLLGSIMESFRRKELNERIPDKAFCCSPVSYILKVSYEQDGKTIEKNTSSSFTILYQ